VTLPSARTPVVDRDKAANVIATGKILRMNASSPVNIAQVMRRVPPFPFVGVRRIAALRESGKA
jgi:hypothetical protein